MLFDIYSAGVTLYRLCNGNPLFYDQFNQYDRDTRRIAIVNGQFPSRDIYKLHIPKKLKKIIKKCLEVKPENRYQTVLELLNDLSQVGELLDWEYTENPDSQIWARETDERKISIVLKKLANLQYELTTTKTIKSSNKTSKITDGCIKSLPQDAVYKTVINLLEKYA
jgi:serine/threonine protein kinase